MALLVVSPTLAVERWWTGQNLLSVARALGLGTPHGPGMALAAGTCLLLLSVVPVYAAATGASFTLAPGALWLLPGLFAQGGIAEETLFRGFLFGHLRIGRTFWRAAALSMLPFVVVHLVPFFTLPFWIALAALALSVVTSFPMARLFDLGGGTIWPSALLHFVIQGTIKVLAVTGDTSSTFPYLWMTAGALIPLLVFLAPGQLAPARTDRRLP